VLITDISRSVYSNLLSTDARCLVIILGGQCDMVDCARSSVARSIGVSRYILLNVRYVSVSKFQISNLLKQQRAKATYRLLKQ